MQNNKGWDFLTTFADINDNYIYQASKPWKENKIKTFKMPLKKVIACAVIVMIVGLGLTHQNESSLGENDFSNWTDSGNL